MEDQTAQPQGQGPRILSVEQILTANDIIERTVHVPQWGGSVRIRGLTKGQHQALRKRATVRSQVETDRLEMLLFAESLIEPRFTLEQVEQLKNKAAAPFETVLKAVLEVNGLADGAVEQAEAEFR
jgi:uncharacterized protein (DUF39 family)